MKALTRSPDPLVASRTRLVLDHPFFGLLALRINFTPETRSRTRTMCTDGRETFYHAPYLSGLSEEELDFWVAHATLRAALQHPIRRGKRDLLRWNHAGAYAVNPILVAAGFMAPEGILLNPAYAGMSAEQIYQELSTESDQDQNRSANSQPLGDPSANGSPDSQPDSRDDGDDNSTYGPSTGDVPQHGSGDIADLPGAVIDGPDPEIQDAEWQVALKQATQVAKMMGRLPGEIKIAVEEVLKPRVNWRAALRHFVQLRANTDYSWSRPNRRYYALGLYLPELRSHSLPPIAVIVDTSGSTEAFLARFKAELQSIVDETQPEAVYVIMADAKVQRVDRFERGQRVDFLVEGLGGTDFEPAFDYIRDEGLNIACAIYLTDGEGRFPKHLSPFPTLWVITSPSIVAPWGQTLHIDTAAA